MSIAEKNYKIRWNVSPPTAFFFDARNKTGFVVPNKIDLPGQRRSVYSLHLHLLLLCTGTGTSVQHIFHSIRSFIDSIMYLPIYYLDFSSSYFTPHCEARRMWKVIDMATDCICIRHVSAMSCRRLIATRDTKHPVWYECNEFIVAFSCYSIRIWISERKKKWKLIGAEGVMNAAAHLMRNEYGATWNWNYIGAKEQCSITNSKRRKKKKIVE